MHPYTNKEFDSKLFIKKIKHTPPFGMPSEQLWWCVCMCVYSIGGGCSSTHTSFVAGR